MRAYSSSLEANTQLSRLLNFVEIEDGKDQQKMARTCQRLVKGIEQDRTAYMGGPWPSSYLRLQNTALKGILKIKGRNEDAVALYVRLVRFTTEAIPELTSSNAVNFYPAMSKALSIVRVHVDVITAPLQSLGPSTEGAYQAFAKYVLTNPDLDKTVEFEPHEQSGLSGLSERINCKLLTTSLDHGIRNSRSAIEFLASSSSSRRAWNSFSEFEEDCAWLAAYLIYFQRQVFGSGQPERYISEPSLTSALCSLLSVVADTSTLKASAIGGSAATDNFIESFGRTFPFISEQLTTLVDQRSISSLVSQMNAGSFESDGPSGLTLAANDRSKALATYILTLLRLFPSRADDIRMWLYIGSSSGFPGSSVAKGQSAIGFFWQAARDTDIFHKIYNDSRAVVALLKPKTSATPAHFMRDKGPASSTSSIEEEWKIVLLFIEIYSFVLKVMDDEEFFAYDNEVLEASSTYGRRNSLRRNEIMTLSTFLKHLGFSMYYSAADILGSREEEASTNLSSLFKPAGNDDTAGQSALSVLEGSI